MKKLHWDGSKSSPWLALALALLVSVPPAHAATNTVTNLNDSDPGSLRNSIAISANGDTINFAVTGTIPGLGGLVIDKNLIISGPGAANLSISGGDPVFSINPGVTVSISGLTVRDGGRGIYNVGTLTLTACAISGNTSYSFGSVAGGGILNEVNGNLSLRDCNISGNTLVGTTAGFSGSYGGGICNWGTLTAVACTISGNTASSPYGPQGGGRGGGIYNEDAFGTLTLYACTINGNSAHFGGGGILGACILRNTLIAGNTGSSEIEGAVTSFGHNLVGRSDGSTGIANGVNGDLAGTSANPLDPKLGALRENGGSTPTHALLFGSPAIDGGDDALLITPFNLTTDQRGFPRKAGGHVDIGAFEFLSGDLNNDGVVDLNELNAVLSSYNNGVVNQSALDAVLARYWPTSPWLMMTNTAGLGTTTVQFALPYPTAWHFTVEVTTNLSNWTPLGPAYPIYQFGDPAATGAPQRSYRLRYP